jgi:ApbE superfamily uncharacterized protein (UPF0280 family)
MKSAKYQRRFYRQWSNVSGLCRMRIVERETDLEILTDKSVDKDFLRERIRLYRRQIENYIAKDPRFLTSLKSINIERKAPLIVRKMAQAAKAAGVGPMAAVAGAIAQFLGRDLLRRGHKEVIIENGGDIFMKITKARSVGLYAGRSKLWRALALKIKPSDTPLGICTSSGTIGHSLSFGSADSAVILAKDACLADAVATATCNRVHAKADLGKALAFARSIKGVKGAVIIFKKNLVASGSVEFA